MHEEASGGTRLGAREIFDRYGPALGVVLALLIIVAIVPSNVPDNAGVGVAPGTRIDPGDLGASPVPGEAGFDPGDPSGPGATVPGAGPGVTTGPSAGGGGGGGGTPTSPGAGGGETGGGGAGGGETAAPQWGPGQFPQPGAETSCRQDGRMPGFGRGGPYNMPQCVPVFRGDNGGSTSRGVTADTITVVRYVGVDQFTIAALQGAGADDPADVALRADRALIHYFNNHMETYGREVKMINYTASGTDDAAARADARDIVSKHKPFLVYPMVFTGAVENILAEELAANGVMCICTSTLPASFYQRLSPYTFASTLPTLEEYYDNLAEFFGKRLANGPATWARGPSVPPLDTSKRKFGVIFFEGSPPAPERKVAVDYFKSKLAPWGVSLTHVNSYLDVRDATEQANNLIAQHKSAGVTTLLCMCDGLAPIFLTQAATRNQYYPEWINPGTVLMDLTFTGRLYDKAQWRNSFGISPLWVFFTNLETSSGYRAYHHARPGEQTGDEGVQINVRQSVLQILFTGVQQAGPNLTPQNFALGLYRWPRVASTPKAPLVFWSPESHGGIKDFTEIWWDEDGTGADETGKQGVGILVKARQGTRYTVGQWPTDPPYAFDHNDIVFTSDSPPETFDHDADGHSHGHADDPNRQRCRSCS